MNEPLKKPPKKRAQFETLGNRCQGLETPVVVRDGRPWRIVLMQTVIRTKFANFNLKTGHSNLKTDRFPTNTPTKMPPSEGTPDGVQTKHQPKTAMALVEDRLDANLKTIHTNQYTNQNASDESKNGNSVITNHDIHEFVIISIYTIDP